MDTKTCMTYTQQRQKYSLTELSHAWLQEHLFELRDCVIFHNERYHIWWDPLVADAEFDHLWHLLEAIEKKYPDLIVPESPTQKLQWQLLETITKASHAPYPLFSLQNTYNSADILARHTHIEKLKEKLCYEGKLTYIIEPKFDGISLKLIYRYGKLSQAITRGDGQVGEDVTAHALQITNLPAWLPALENIAEMHCRGEVVMTKHAFKRLNAYQIEEDLPVFANARNAAAGTMRQLSTEIVQKRWLQVYIYDCCNRVELDLPHTQSELLKKLTDRWLPVYAWTKTNLPIEEVITCCETILPELEKAPIEFDGLVVKVEDTTLRADDKMGTTAHHPRRAVAYKFPAQIATTQVREIIYQVGRTGVVTPVAILEPVQLAWALISKATLHNIDQMQKMDLREHDYVWLQRSGEVIPYIVWPVLERREEGAQPMLAPTQCPVCATPLVPSETEIAWYCPNVSCSARRKAQIKHFVSRQALAIDGLGESGVDSLVDAGIIYDYADLLTLLEPKYRMQLQAMPGIGSKKIHQLLSELERTKKPELWRLLHGLGIPFVGKKIAQSLADAILKEHPAPTLSDLQQVCTDEVFLQAIFGIGKQTIQAVVSFFREPSSFERLAHFFAQGVEIHAPQHLKKEVGLLTWQTIVITGTFSVSREAIAQRLLTQWAVVASAVTWSTTLVLYGKDPGSKLTKAQEQGILCVDWSWLFAAFSWLIDPFVVNTSIASPAPQQQGLFS
jgi:DNA ligase (NAD+)